MDSGSTPVKSVECERMESRESLRRLAETVVAVAHTLGCGDEEDDRVIDETERSVWVELRLACPDRQEREHLIANGRAVIAAPGSSACQRAAGLLISTAGWLLHTASGLEAGERARMEMCADRCVRTAARLERIALEAAGS